jgi:SAM-dependent methyltransferase
MMPSSLTPHTCQPLKAGNLPTKAPGVAQHGPCVDLVMIAGLMPQCTHVLDVGCGVGKLLAEANKGVKWRGVEISHYNIKICMWRGLSVILSDAGSYLVFYLDNLFDVVVMTHILAAWSPLAGAPPAIITQTHVVNVSAALFLEDSPNIAICIARHVVNSCAEVGTKVERTMALNANSSCLLMTYALMVFLLLREQAVGCAATLS